MVVAMVPGPAIMGMARGKTLTSSRVRASAVSAFVSRAPEEHVDADEKEQDAAGDVEGIEIDAQAGKDEASDDSKKGDDERANDNGSRDDNIALLLVHMPGKRNHDRRQTNGIDNGNKGHDGPQGKGDKQATNLTAFVFSISQSLTPRHAMSKT